MNKKVMSQSDVITVEIPKMPEEKHDQIEMGISSIIGTRKTQQDTVFGNCSEDGTIAIVCDGMGGLRGGEIASKVAVETMARDYFDAGEILNIPEFLRQEAVKIDTTVFDLESEDGEALDAGTTMVAVIIKGNKLYWLSVGDSRIYLIRNKNEIVVVNREHNYRYALNQQLKQGMITQEYYESQEGKGDALISFMGMGNVSLMDVNQAPFLLCDGDMILLCSDGLYRSLSEDKIMETINKNMPDIDRTAHCLTAYAMDATDGGQDNTSLVLLKYTK